MPLAPGSRVGVYEVIALLGRGGMGEVYRARDSKLNREVAIKILPPPFGLDPHRLLRFEREARLLAALNHPNVGAIFGLEEHCASKIRFMALVEDLRSPSGSRRDRCRSTGPVVARASPRASRRRTRRESSIAT